MSLRWSCYAAGLDQPGEPWLEEDPDAVLKTASVGKLLLLAEVARRLGTGELRRDERVSRAGSQFVRDSGLWHALDQEDLTIPDACRLVGAVSDNLATNVLIDRVGLPAVAEFGRSIDAHPMELLDQVRGVPRDLSVPGTPPTLSRASARSLVRFMTALYDGRVSPDVEEWTSLSTDLSMFASAFDEDPLAHNAIGDEAHPALINKTGTDDGIRADVGLVRSGPRTVAYAVIANWESDDAPPGLGAVLTRMRAIGADLRHRLAEEARTSVDDPQDGRG